MIIFADYRDPNRVPKTLDRIIWSDKTQWESICVFYVLKVLEFYFCAVLLRKKMLIHKLFF